MNNNVFTAPSYREFVRNILIDPKYGRGSQTKLAHAIQVQPAFVSQVLSGKLHFTPEQAAALGDFFDLDESERSYLLMLVAYERAGTERLRTLLRKQMSEALAKHNLVQSRVSIKDSVAEDAQAIYYSSWHYAAVHMALTVPALRTKEALRKCLKIRSEKLDSVLTFLIRVGLVEKKAGDYSVSGKRIHLGNESPLLPAHHKNMKIHALDSISYSGPADLHYGAFFSCSKKDLITIKERILKLLGEFNSIVTPSNEEVIAAFGIDLYSVG